MTFKNIYSTTYNFNPQKTLIIKPNRVKSLLFTTYDIVLLIDAFIIFHKKTTYTDFEKLKNSQNKFIIYNHKRRFPLSM